MIDRNPYRVIVQQTNRVDSAHLPLGEFDIDHLSIDEFDITHLPLGEFDIARLSIDEFVFIFDRGPARVHVEAPRCPSVVKKTTRVQ